MHNCKNCGAPLKSTICEYCETHYDISEVDFLKDCEVTTLYANGEPIEEIISFPNQRLGQLTSAMSSMGCTLNEARDAFIKFSELSRKAGFNFGTET